MNTAATEVKPEASTQPRAEAPAFVLTPGAVAQVKTVMAEQKLEGTFFTVRVVPGGCNGFGYDLNLLHETKSGDLVWEQDGLKLCTDPISVKLLGGTEVDYLRSEVAAGFKFKNPNEKSSCGCGSSFSV